MVVVTLEPPCSPYGQYQVAVEERKETSSTQLEFDLVSSIQALESSKWLIPKLSNPTEHLNITHRCWRLVCKSEEIGKGAAASLGCPLAIGSTGRTKDTKQYVARIPTWREA